MNKRLIIIVLALISICDVWATVIENPRAVVDLIVRIGGEQSTKLMCTELDSSISEEQFVITSRKKRPCIKASTMSALTCGIGWYLNHYANVNVSWNNPTVDLTKIKLPLPQGEDVHKCAVDYRYYLNYCTFSYSMSTWTWQRWQQEIDWMALHGVNMPLQIVGLETVWRDMLKTEYGYTDAEVNEFVAGPCFMAWFGMNNLEGWGGPNPEWWYERQRQLCTKIVGRMRDLGIEPVLPGYSGMVPSDFTTKTGIRSIDQGCWCNFRRPYILDPNSEAFAEVAEKYYKHLHEVMGKSKCYSMDPFHEGANTSGIDVAAAYSQIFKQMNKANANSKWVIQQWQWSKSQYQVLDNVPVNRLIVLDLFSDGRPNLDAYKDHEVVYCILPNFGGRTGLMGRFDKMINEFFDAKNNIKTVCGIGAAPESIEQVSVLYDAIYELPWMAEKPNTQTWMKEYAERRYGASDENAIAAWQLVRTSALNCSSSLQGPHEAVTCARPAWHIDRVSSWGGTKIFYDANAIVKAAKLMLAADLAGENYDYDLIDVTRQALTDYAYKLQQEISDAHALENEALQDSLQSRFINLIYDIDDLLSCNKNFMLGKWTKMARAIADEMPNTSDADCDWLELKNARTLITIWGERENAEKSGLRDYSYRQWSGMLRDFYGERWKKFFYDNEEQDWFELDKKWASDAKLKYDDEPEGKAEEVAAKLINKYFK